MIEGRVGLGQFQDSLVGLQSIGLLLLPCLHLPQGSLVLRAAPFDALEQLAHVHFHLFRHHHDHFCLQQHSCTGNTRPEKDLLALSICLIILLFTVFSGFMTACQSVYDSLQNLIYHKHCPNTFCIASVCFSLLLYHFKIRYL